MAEPLGWSVAEAVAKFAEQGMPVDPVRFRIAVMKVAKVKRVGEKRAPPGSQGGRREGLYPIGELQQLHRALAPWMVTWPAVPPDQAL